ncbi:type II toxin-antitoxin system prevent-host-death family antitoxin [Paenarthrobacter sp. Z7-10]|uniref:type II toxin-antitoxin system Phd/YefM family antitoxin n=1 Tax=Paenarthrobacter sp. Z7-10 TaxID=2787635 RepID=UPI0022A9CBBA|nr:type II toxin-antitoxin system prevent-host-death family antitoxin [Paenarthrobacter sp. Z7-10]MCZ2403100.1 type II toxin-antitoxin system prevent-host-death family antitoxin [Paenarthrobacter sp. Z7-10]
MVTANVHQAKTNLSKLLDAADRGEEVVITRRGSGSNRFVLKPANSPATGGLFGSLRGKIQLSSDYDDGDAEIARMFEAALDRRGKDRS